MNSAYSYRTAANRVLLGAFGCFCAAAAVKYRLGSGFWTELIFHVTQAALIGGIADWFAVTALFEKPLGFPWHTALIPRNRHKMIEGIAGTVERDLLSPALLRERLYDVRLVPAIIAWLDSETGRQRMLGWITSYISQVLARLDQTALTLQFSNMLREAAAHIPLDQQLKVLGRWVLVRRKDEQAAELILDQLIQAIVSDKAGEALYEYLQEVSRQAARSPLTRLALWLGEQTDSINLRDLAKALQQDAAALLIPLKSGDHPVRRWCRKKLFDFWCRLKREQQLTASLQEWSGQVAGRLPVEDVIAQLIKAALDPRIYHSPLLIWALQQVSNQWELFKQDQKAQEWVDNLLRQAIGNMIESQHSFIGTVVREALTAFSDDDISRFVEERIGDDLAWIRINGSVVGAAVGLVLYLIMYFVYDPYVVPIIRTWIG